MDYHSLIKIMKAKGHGLMSEGQYLEISKFLDIQSPCNLLVFGLGMDSLLWKKINQKGQTVFLEDDASWISKFKNTDLDIYNVQYTTEAKDHEIIDFNTGILHMNLPEEVLRTEWDFIIVDGPLGHNPPRPYKGPGRMQSIYMAHLLLKQGGICVIDDMARLIESRYADYFFGQENLLTPELIENKIGVYKKNEQI